jgi:hypothetical protein
VDQALHAAVPKNGDAARPRKTSRDPAAAGPNPPDGLFALCPNDDGGHVLSIDRGVEKLRTRQL